MKVNINLRGMTRQANPRKFTFVGLIRASHLI